MPVERFESELRLLLEKNSRIYTDLTHPSAKKLEMLAPFRTQVSATQPIAHLRMKKSPAEIDAIQHTTDISVEAHKEAWKKTAAGVNEYEVAAAMTTYYYTHGCERDSYPSIVGSGPNATILHYEKNTRRMDGGELLLMDAAAECGGYASDITRTIPVGGKFTPRQKEIYDIVLGAQNAVMDAIKPGVLITGLTKIARDYINAHGKDLHGETLGKYLTHGVSHHVGLNVHDATDPTVPLTAGMVITVEPGIYIPEESIGIRIEDTVLVTETGIKNLSGALPREAGAVEEFLKSRKY
jgi:Xaa-Pro aminopeptidase